MIATNPSPGFSLHLTSRLPLLRWAGWSFVILPLFFLLALLTLRNAWIADDAFITLRVVGNWLSGEGPVYNPGFRVQAYTHPLWMLLLAGSIGLTGEFYLTPLAIGWSVTLAAALLLALRLARTPALAALGLASLLMSKAFVDYSTSGLENPLSHLLLLWFAAETLLSSSPRGAVPRALLAASLVMLTRLDAAALILPPLAWILWRHRGSYSRSLAALALSPLLLWLLFSFFYYGFPLPNTAYAKAFGGPPAAWRWSQGVFYLINSLRLDPLTLVLTACGIAAGLARRGAPRALAAGVILGLLYVIHIGGDFMSGRFLTAPFVVALALLVSIPWRPAWLAGLAGLALLAGAPTFRRLAADNPAHASYSLRYLDAHAICDERPFYLGRTGLGNAARELRTYPPAPRPKPPARAVRIVYSAGIDPFLEGPSLHAVDEMALADPLLVRLPARIGPLWRVGHLERRIPAGYTDTLRTGRNVIADPAVARLYDRVEFVTRGDLWSLRRLREAFRLNLGHYARSIDRAFFTTPYYDHLKVAPSEQQPDLRPWDHRMNHLVDRKQGLTLYLAPTPRAARLGVSLDGRHAWQIAVRSSGRTTATVSIPALGDSFSTRWFDLPAEGRDQPVDELRLVPEGTDPFPVFGEVAFAAPNLHPPASAPRPPGDCAGITCY